MTSIAPQASRETASLSAGDGPARTRRRGAIRRFLRRSPALVCAVVGLVLLAGFGALVLRSREIDADVHREVVVLVHQLRQLDADWNVEALRFRAGLTASHDPVSSPQPLVDALAASLRRRSGWIWLSHDADRARILQLMERSKLLIEQKAVLLERFKSQHAILRSSTRYLPSAAAEVLAGLDALAPAAREAAAHQVDDALTQALVYVNMPEGLTAGKLSEALVRLQQLGSSLPPGPAERVAGFYVHASTVLKQEQLGAQLLAELAALPSAQSLDDLLDAHAQEHEKLERAQQQSRWLLEGYGALLLLVLAYAARRLVGGHRRLGKLSAELQRGAARLKDAQAQTLQCERMSALGQMVGGIAQELHAPLSQVKGRLEGLGGQAAALASLAGHAQEFVQMMRDPQRNHDREQFNREFRGLEAATQEVVQRGALQALEQQRQEGLQGVGQIAEVLASVQNFSRRDPGKAEEFSVHEGLESTLVLARHLLKDRVEVRREFGQVPAIHGSPVQLNQVFLTLITNAVHAMPPGRAEPGVITLRTRMEARDMLRVEIQDNGVGIPDDVLPRIFDPVFTRADAGQGIGLSVSFQTVQEHGGMILVHTEPGAGTVFAVLLPVRPRRKTAPQAAGVLASA